MARSASADPLVIEAEGSRYPGHPIRGYFENSRQQWHDEAADHQTTGLFVLPLSPDMTFKANVSGGAPCEPPPAATIRASALTAV